MISKTKASLTLSLLMIGLMSSCGPASESDPSSIGEASRGMADVMMLQVGSSADQLKVNEVIFAPLSKGKQSKTLYFEAPSNGELSRDNILFIYGTNCDGDQRKSKYSFDPPFIDFNVSVSVFLKDRETGEFSIETHPEEPLPSLTPSYRLKAGDEIKIRISYESPIHCESASLRLGAAFKKKG
jgi:hypothetical protein